MGRRPRSRVRAQPPCRTAGAGGLSTEATVSRARTPVVVGVSGGVGTTTVATALNGRDRGKFTGRPIDVLVCRSTSQSLLLAGNAAQCLSYSPELRPVLAVTADGPCAPTKAINARLRMVEPHTAAVVVLPYVRRWRESARPLSDLLALLELPASQLDRQLRDYAAAVQALVAAVSDMQCLKPPGPRQQRDRAAVAPISVRDLHTYRLLRGATS